MLHAAHHTVTSVVWHVLNTPHSHLCTVVSLCWPPGDLAEFSFWLWKVLSRFVHCMCPSLLRFGSTIVEAWAHVLMGTAPTCFVDRCRLWLRQSLHLGCVVVDGVGSCSYAAVGALSLPCLQRCVNDHHLMFRKRSIVFCVDGVDRHTQHALGLCYL